MAWEMFGDVEFDVGEDGDVIVTTYEMANGGVTPRLEADFPADRERLQALERGARWALARLDEAGGGR